MKGPRTTRTLWTSATDQAPPLRRLLGVAALDPEELDREPREEQREADHHELDRRPVDQAVPHDVQDAARENDRPDEHQDVVADSSALARPQLPLVIPHRIPPTREGKAPDAPPVARPARTAAPAPALARGAEDDERGVGADADEGE